MSTATIGITGELDSALRRGFSDAGVRLQPETKTSEIVAALTTLGLTIEIQDGILLLQQGSTQMNTSLALRNFSTRPEHAKFFVLRGDHPSSWSKEDKVKYLRTHSADEYARLCRSQALDPGIKVLDPNMSAKDYRQLTRQERMQFIALYGADAVSRVMGIRP
jgi:hypothetical protein